MTIRFHWQNKCLSLFSKGSYTRLSLLNEPIVANVPTHKSFELLTIVSHIFSWFTQCFEQGNTSNVATHKSVCQALNHCLAHIELVHSLFSTTTPTRQLPAVRSLLKQLFMPGGDGFDEKCKKKQSWRPRRWLCRLLPELQMCKFHAWSNSGNAHIHHTATDTNVLNNFRLKRNN